MAVVLAANGLSVAAATAADADDSDRGASHAEKNIDILHHDAKEAQQSRASCGTSLKGAWSASYSLKHLR